MRNKIVPCSVSIQMYLIMVWPSSISSCSVLASGISGSTPLIITDNIGAWRGGGVCLIRFASSLLGVRRGDGVCRIGFVSSLIKMTLEPTISWLNLLWMVKAMLWSYYLMMMTFLVEIILQMLSRGTYLISYCNSSYRVWNVVSKLVSRNEYVGLEGNDVTCAAVKSLSCGDQNQTQLMVI